MELASPAGPAATAAEVTDWVEIDDADPSRPPTEAVASMSLDTSPPTALAEPAGAAVEPTAITV